MKLPTHGLMDSVYTLEEVAASCMTASFFCKHKSTTPFIWIDHSAGSGSFADTYKGYACVNCRKILVSKLTHKMSYEENVEWDKLTPQIHEAHRLRGRT